jgi:hypothetical protein
MLGWSHALGVRQRQFGNLIDSLSPVLNVTISTQVVHYAEGTPVPLVDSTTGRHYVPADELHAYLSVPTLPRAHLPSSTDRLMFVAHLPHPRVSPLELRTNDGSPAPGNTFSVPQWGAVHAIKHVIALCLISTAEGREYIMRRVPTECVESSCDSSFQTLTHSSTPFRDTPSTFAQAHC